MAIRINRVYTRGGDAGETSLVGGQRIAKDAIRIESYGTVDELNALLGLVRTANRDGAGAARKADRDRLDRVLEQIQNELFNLGSALLAGPLGSEDATGAGASLEPHEELTRNGLAACAVIAALLGLLGRGLAAQEVPRIDVVEIRTTNVFAPQEAAKSFFPYGLANALHFTTRSSFIQEQLLFQPGDDLRPDLLAETERNLRAFGLFRRAYVRAEGTRVVVETADAWTLLLRGSLSNKGGVTTYSMGAEEDNLLGTGRQFGFGLEKDVDRISRSVFYADPDLFVPHNLLRLDAADNSDGRFLQFALGRPFYAYDAPWALQSTMLRFDFDTKLYAGGEESTLWKEEERGILLTGGRLVSRDPGGADRLLGSIEWTTVRLLDGR